MALSHLTFRFLDIFSLKNLLAQCSGRCCKVCSKTLSLDQLSIYLRALFFQLRASHNPRHQDE